MKMINIFFLGVFGLSLMASDVVFGVVPQQSPSVLIKNWKPVTDYLSQKTGLNVILSIEKSIPAFEKKLNSGVYDVAYVNPYHYVVARKERGYDAKIRAKKMIVGILVSMKSRESESVDFGEMRYLFPSPLAFAATILPKYEIKEKYGVDIDKDCDLKYVNSHDSVYKGVARGIGDIGGGIERTFNNLKDKETKERLKIIYKTRPYPSHPIVFHPRLDKKEAALLNEAILSLPDELLKALSIKTLIETNDGEYDVIRKLSKNIRKQE